MEWWEINPDSEGRFINRPRRFMNGMAQYVASRTVALRDRQEIGRQMTEGRRQMGRYKRKSATDKKMILRDGMYLLRTNLTETEPDVIWRRYVLLTQVEAAFKSLKSDLAIRPVYHQLEHRVDAHIFVAFLAYCLMVTLRQKFSFHAPGLTARDVLDKLGTIMMIDVRIPTAEAHSFPLRGGLDNLRTAGLLQSESARKLDRRA